MTLVLTIGSAVALLTGKDFDSPAAAATGNRSAALIRDARSPALPVSATFAAALQQVRSGVVRLDVLGCDESGVGTGFLLSPTLVATVDHLVTGSVVIGVTAGSRHTTGRVIGTDARTDLALVETDKPIAGHHFEFASRTPAVGERVAALGYQGRGRITDAQGTVDGVDRSATGGVRSQSGVIETDAAVRASAAGGPLLADDGTVLGVVDTSTDDGVGLAYAVPAKRADRILASWRAAPQDLDPARCGSPRGPARPRTTFASIRGLTNDASAGIATAFEKYFGDLNDGDFAGAREVLDRTMRNASPDGPFTRNYAAGYTFDHRVREVEQASSSTVTVRLSFTSLQAPGTGPDDDTCDTWTLVFTMTDGYDGSWYIDAIAPHEGTYYVAC